MHRFAPVALATILAATVPAQLCAQAATPFTVPPAAGHFTDPANLAGERVRPRDGRELPIDGGLGANNQPDNALGLAQLLRKLNTRASLMLIVAHPDDEDGGMLTYYSRGLGARVAVLTLTRGEGGQNQMTGDFEDALGLLRTQELLSADRYMGVDTQMFGTEVDFGFTKTKAEAFQKWNHERVLYDAVRAVRIFRPLVIAAVFSGAVTDGHGQHQVSGQITQEVFKAAGDPNVFPELTREGILPWQPLKVYARVPFSRVTDKGLYDYATGQTVPAEFTNYVTGQTFTTEPTADVTINEGATDPLLTTCAANPADLPASLRSTNPLSSRPEAAQSADGAERPLYSARTATSCHPLTYVQFARIGLGLQRTQIGANVRVPPAGAFDVGYHLYGSRVCAPNLPNPTPNLCSTTAAATNTPANTPGAPPSASERRQGGVSRAVARDKTLIAPIMLASFTTTKAPTARLMTAQGNALGTGPNEESSAEGAPYNPALANQPTFFEGIDTSLEGVGSLSTPVPLLQHVLQNISTKIQLAINSFDPSQPSKIAPQLAEALKSVDDAISVVQELKLGVPYAKENILHELRIKRVQLNDALVLALGLSLNAELSDPSVPVVTGKPFKAAAILRSSTLTAENPHFLFNDLAPAQQNEASSLGWGAQATSAMPAPIFPTVPYFTRPNIEQPFYDLTTPELRLAPQTPPPFVVTATVDYRGTKLRLAHTVNGPSTSANLAIASRAANQVEQPVQVTAPGSIFLSSHAQVLPDSAGAFEVTVTSRPQALIKEDIAWNGLPGSWKLSSGKPFLETGTQRFTVNTPKDGHHAVTLNASFTRPDGSLDIEGGFRSVGYGNLPRTNYYVPSTLRVVRTDLKLPPENKRRIAYLPGTGDDVPAALASIGLAPTILKVSDLTAANLAHFDTVILGVRTYNAHPDLHGAPTQALLDFARNGGNVLVQYQSLGFTAADAPYPLSLGSNEKVVDETAPVVLLTTANSKLQTDSQTESAAATSRYPEPSSSGLIANQKENAQGFSPAYALLTTPNKITPADFNNWIEERGHGFLDSWDPHYTALTEVHDPGAPAEHIEPQAPQRGGLITVQLGKGRWTYCAFALYRQLPEAVPGAFRLFVNLLDP